MSPQPATTNTAKQLFIKVSLRHLKVLLGVYYLPSSRINLYSSFESKLQNLILSQSHAIIMSDFNTCLLKNDIRSSTFRTVVKSSNLFIPLLNATHNFPNCTPSLPDFF